MSVVTSLTNLWITQHHSNKKPKHYKFTNKMVLISLKHNMFMFSVHKCVLCKKANQRELRQRRTKQQQGPCWVHLKAWFLDCSHSHKHEYCCVGGHLPSACICSPLYLYWGLQQGDGLHFLWQWARRHGGRREKKKTKHFSFCCCRLPLFPPNKATLTPALAAFCWCVLTSFPPFKNIWCGGTSQTGARGEKTKNNQQRESMK